MAHELHFTNGVADFFEVGAIKTAWHREGTLLPHAPSLDEAIQLCHMGYTVESVATYQQIIDAAGVATMQLTPAHVTRRTDTHEWLGTVTEQYKPVQNRDALRALEPMLDSGIITLETGGVLRKGADAWLLGRFNIEQFGPVVREVFADEVVPYALIAINHSGRRGTIAQLTPIRVVCANTLAASEACGSTISIPHIGNAVQKTVEAAEALFKGIVERYETVAKSYRFLKATILTEDEFESKVLAIAAPDPREHRNWNPEAKMAKSVIERWEKKATAVTRLWTEGKGHTGDHSAWEAYNGVVEAIDHNRELYPVRGGVYATASLMHGHLADVKHDVLESLMMDADYEVLHD